MEWVGNSIRRLHAALRRRGWKRHDAEDAIQDAFLRMQRYCNDGGEVRNREAFLMRTVLNLTANARSRDNSHLFVTETVEEGSLVLGMAPAPEEVLAADERLAKITAQIESLTPRTREIFVLHYIDNYSYPQISKQLGISISAIEKHVARAMLTLTEER